VWLAQISSTADSRTPGTIVEIAADGVVVACGEHGKERLRLATMQLPGGRRQDAAQVAQQLQLTDGMQAAK
jgi:methionyl-tRNA formyltransferase